MALNEQPDSCGLSEDQKKRKRCLETLGVAHLEELKNTLHLIGAVPKFSFVRKPERGLMMVRGRTGGTGSAFNLGEVTVARASVCLEDGTLGHSCILGTDIKKAEICAMLDACAQSDHQSAVEAQPHIQKLLADVSRRIANENDRRHRDTAATKVDFFTMSRGE